VRGRLLLGLIFHQHSRGDCISICNEEFSTLAFALLELCITSCSVEPRPPQTILTTLRAERRNNTTTFARWRCIVLDISPLKLTYPCTDSSSTSSTSPPPSSFHSPPPSPFPHLYSPSLPPHSQHQPPSPFFPILAASHPCIPNPPIQYHHPHPKLHTSLHFSPLPPHSYANCLIILKNDKPYLPTQLPARNAPPLVES